MATETAIDIRIPRVAPEIYNAIEKHRENETRTYLHNMALVLIKEALAAREQQQEQEAA